MSPITTLIAWLITALLLTIMTWSLARDPEIDERAVAVFAFFTIVAMVVFAGSVMRYLGV